ncbi:MAG: four helix bundle protein [Bacteroidaceae bacterium]|nr:four helix bundle protein [Bacteroidaceae bacterium]MBQ7741709.1 four helix bundle protein [Bacteroidaceae bacterium]
MDMSVLQEKSENFAVRVVNLYKFLVKKQEFEISKQLKRSGTSVGANITEALFGSSKKDYLAKMYIAFKECNETMYWLRVLHRTDYLNDSEYNSIYGDCRELVKMLASTIKTTKENLN